MRWFGDLAERLLDTGWPAPVPLRPQSKAPLIAGWTRYNAEPVAATTLAAWVRRHPTAGIGHPAGHGIVFIDMDEDDPARATHRKALARELLGVTPLRRIGRPPREVVVYRRAAGSVMPSVLAATPSLSQYLDSGQVTLFAIHPGTARPYALPLDDPTTVAPNDLPVVTDTQLPDLLEAARALPWDPRRPSRATPLGDERLATPVLEAMRQAGAQALEVARRHVVDAEPGHRHHHLVGAVVALVITGFTDEQIHAAAAAPFVGLFDAAEVRHRRPAAEARAVLDWARRTIGGAPPDLELPRPRWARG